jgi:predicted small lipoprotein YifL
VRNFKQLLKLSVFTSILLLVGCGQKGPLYLEDSSAKETTSPSDSLQNTDSE